MAIEMTGIPNTTTSVTQGDGSPANATQNNADRSASGNSTKNAVVDDVTITQDARNLIKIEANVSTQSEVDQNRVADLKMEIDSGRYNINASRVAEKFLQFESMLAV